MTSPLKYCYRCGSALEQKTPAGDNRVRATCTQCDHIHYVNPKIVAGALVYHEDKVLLCRRAIEPRYGLWTAPAGFMETEETTREAAERETREEANAIITTENLFVVANITYISQVYMLYLAKLENTDFSPGEESLEVALFEQKDIPWDQLAFPTVTFALERFFDLSLDTARQAQPHEITFSDSHRKKV